MLRLPPSLRVVARSAQDTFEVSALAFRAARASLTEHPEILRRAAENARLRDRLQAVLGEVGVAYWPSSANFVCAAPADPAAFIAGLASEGVIVRGTAAFGDPTRVRIGVPAERNLGWLESALRVATGHG